MTEVEWLESIDTATMLQFLGPQRGSRKSRLFSVACCYRIADLTSGPARRAILAAEQFADGQISQADLHHACNTIDRPTDERRRIASAAARSASCRPDYDGTADAAECVVMARRSSWKARRTERSKLAALLRDIFGNPFRPVAFDPRWRTTDVVGVAQAIYDDRAFERLPILADALMDAGCDSDDILSHCRSEGPHVRGCWVVDLVLGQE